MNLRDLRHLLAVILIVAVTGCAADDRPQVVLYVSVDEHIARQVIDAFEAKHEIRVKMAGDTEAKKTTGLVERLRAEKSNPRADVFWSSEIFMTIELAEEGLLEPHQSAATANWPGAYRDDKFRWYGFAGRARVIAYAPDRVASELVPKTWLELASREQYKNRMVMADPRFGTTGGHLGAMKAYWDRHVMPGYYEAFLDGLYHNRMRMLASGNAGVVEAIARGEADLGMTDSDDVLAAKARGINIEMVYPLHTGAGSPALRAGSTGGAGSESRGAGTLLIPNTVARIKGGPNPQAASKLIDFLLSDQVERMLAESVSRNVPLRHGATELADFLKIDYVRAARVRAEAVSMAMETLSAPPPQPPFRRPPEEGRFGDASQ